VLAHCGAAPVEVWPQLQEIRAGRLRELPLEAFPALQQPGVTRDTRFLGGERLGDFQDRVLPLLADLRARPGWDTALVVAHGVVNAVWLSFIASAGASAWLPAWQQNPACINLIDLGAAPGQDLLRAVNLNPLDLLQPQDRESTLEHVLTQFRSLR
jgi:broad specificity phosphatase PhoE